MAALHRSFVAAFRRWLVAGGGGGPAWPEGMPHELPPRQRSREALLNRYEGHTKNCPTCLGVSGCDAYPLVRHCAAEDFAWIGYGGQQLSVCGGLMKMKAAKAAACRPLSQTEMMHVVRTSIRLRWIAPHLLHAVRQALRNFEILRAAAASAGGTMLLALSVVLARGAAPESRLALGLLAGAAVSGAVWRKASDFIAEFYYVPYVHQDRP